uniref:Putative ovule protein n=1 Tax=Solanum chacoense TaxID=4108 RepID=A0A0V0GQG7_SOLCH
MGACASVPKGMRAEEMAAPPPEQRKEEETTTTAPEVIEVTQDGDDKHQSLGSLLNESEVAKESAKDEKSSDTKEAKGEELPVSNAAAEAS